MEGLFPVPHSINIKLEGYPFCLNGTLKVKVPVNKGIISLLVDHYTSKHSLTPLLNDITVKAAYELWEDDACPTNVSHFPPIGVNSAKEEAKLRSLGRMQLSFNAGETPVVENNVKGRLSSYSCTFQSITCPLFYIVDQHFICKNVACGTHLEEIVQREPGVDSVNLHQFDQISSRYSNGRAGKCKRCRSELEEVLEERISNSVQYALCSPTLDDAKIKWDIMVELRDPFVWKFEVGQSVLVHGFPKLSSDGGLLSKLMAEPTIFLQVLSIQPVILRPGLVSNETSDGVDNIDGLLTRFCSGALESQLWRHLKLMLIASSTSSSIGSPLSLLIITDDTNIVAKLVSCLPGIKTLQYDSTHVNTVKKFSSKFVEGNQYSLTTGGQVESRLDGCLFIENIEVLTTSERKAIFGVERRCGVIACCPMSHLKKIKEHLTQFDLVHCQPFNRTDDLEAIDFIMKFTTTPSINLLGSTLSNEQIKPDCESLLKEYFVASRKTIGQHNELSRFPIFDPSRQLSLGFALARIFQALRSGHEVSRVDVLLSIVLQEVNLEHRLGHSVFTRQEMDNGYCLPYGMPSPCPSEAQQVPSTSTLTGSGTNFQSRYKEVVESIRTQLNI